MTDIDRADHSATLLHVAAPGYEEQLASELQDRTGVERIAAHLFLRPDDGAPVAWAQCTWFDVERLRIDSIGEAARHLRERGPWWQPVVGDCARRTQLVADKLLRIRDKVTTFPMPRQPKARGGFLLLDPHTMLVARRCDRPFSDGQVPFQEDRENPPSRAYLKLWEACTLLGDRPGPGDRVLELGAAPGAWTWTLAQLGAEVHSVDKAPLDPRIDAMPGVHHRQTSAFGLDPAAEAVTWLVSDIICYPERLENLIARWSDHPTCRRFVITIKFQGETDFAAIRRFQQIPDSWIIHLSANKHECTWLKHPAISGQRPSAWPWPTAAPLTAGDH